MRLRISSAIPILALLVSAVIVGAGAAMASDLGQARARPVCGPRAETLEANAEVRVYRVEGPRYSYKVFGCLPGFRPRRLDSPRIADTPWEGPTSPWIDGELIALDVPWISYQEDFANVDVGDKAVGVLNLRSGAIRHCPVGQWDANNRTGFQMTGITVTKKGSAAWIGEHQELGTAVDEVHSCEGPRRRLLDEGNEIDLHSLRLKGTTLSWTDAGRPRSAQLK